MKLHFNEDGSVVMCLNLRGVRIEKIFLTYNDYLKYLTTIF